MCSHGQVEQRGSDPVGRNVAPEDVPSANVTVESPAVLAELAVDIAEAAADHVRRRRPELFGGPGPQAAEDGVEAVTTKSTPTDPVTWRTPKPSN